MPPPPGPPRPVPWPRSPNPLSLRHARRRPPPTHPHSHRRAQHRLQMSDSSSVNTHTHTHTPRRRRRCGPLVVRTRSPTPWCLPVPTDWESGRRWGDPDRGPTRLSIMAPALLFVSSPQNPDPRNTPTESCGHHSGSLGAGGGEAGNLAPLPVRLPTPPQGVGTQSHGCEPLTRQVLPKPWTATAQRRREGRPSDAGARHTLHTALG